MSRYDSLFETVASTAMPLLVTQTTQIVTQLIGLAVLAGTLAALAALTYRWYTREAIPQMLALLIGLAGVALYLNTTTALGQAVVGDLELAQDFQLALYHLAAFISGGIGALGGRRVGDHFGTDVLLEGTEAAADSEVNRLVQAIGRVIVVELPNEIDDVVGYDPVPKQTKKALAGKRFVFPRNLTVDELHSRLVARLMTDYAVGHVDVELADDGTVEYLAVGSRAAGIGPTLPPATNAVAIRADPAFAASSGDLVQVWETDPMRRVATAELRGVADDIVTIAIDSADTPRLDPTREYRLVTLSVDDRPAREFASLLRAADETFSSVTVAAGSPLHGLPIAALDVAVLAIKPEADEQVVRPDSKYVLAPGETVFVIARPERLRLLEAAAEPLDSTVIGKTIAADNAAGVPPTESEATTSGTRPSSAAEAGDDPAEGAQEPVVRGRAETSPNASSPSFEKLKEEFESGEADWVDDESTGERSQEAETPADDRAEVSPDDVRAHSRDEDTTQSRENVVPLEDADISFGSDDDETLSALGFGDDNDDELSALDFDDDDEDEDEDDDLSTLGFDDDDEEFSFESESEHESESETEDDDDEESGGGTSTFAQLKEEFESGEADWADDIPDDPGGDMRLDE